MDSVEEMLGALGDELMEAMQDRESRPVSEGFFHYVKTLVSLEPGLFDGVRMTESISGGCTQYRIEF